MDASRDYDIRSISGTTDGWYCPHGYLRSYCKSGCITRTEQDDWYLSPLRHEIVARYLSPSVAAPEPLPRKPKARNRGYEPRDAETGGILFGLVIIAAALAAFINVVCSR